MFKKILHKTIYLDNAASTKPSWASLCAFFKTTILYANPNSIHDMGNKASQVLQNNRTLIRQNVQASLNSELVFTSGGTESNTLAVRGITNKWLRENEGQIARVLCTSLEHPSVKSLLEEMPDVKLIEVACSKKGQLNIKDFEEKLVGENVVLVCCVHSAGEVGAVQPIAEIGKVIEKIRGKNSYPLFHVDASQGMLLHKANVAQWRCNTATFCSQKIMGLKGVGALYVKKGTPIYSLTGGEGENGMRSGTQSLALIAAFAKSYTQSQSKIDKNKLKIASLRKIFLENLDKHKVNYVVNGREDENSIILNLSFPSIKKNSEELLLFFSQNGIMASSKSACSNSQSEKSQALSAMGIEPANSIRFSFSPNQSGWEIKKAAQIISKLIA